MKIKAGVIELGLSLRSAATGQERALALTPDSGLSRARAAILVEFGA